MYADCVPQRTVRTRQVNGAVAGMGFGFALTCDIRFANRDAKWCEKFGAALHPGAIQCAPSSRRESVPPFSGTTMRSGPRSGAFSKRGLVAEWGTSFLLPRLIGTGNAMVLIFPRDSRLC